MYYFLNINPYDTENSFKLWKKNVRQTILLFTGYNYIHQLIKKIIISLRLIDEIITQNYIHSKKNKFDMSLLQKELSQFELMINNIEKKNPVNKFIQRLTGVYYFSNKILPWLSFSYSD